MPELALVLWGAYFLLALVLRVALQLRRTGRTGLLLGRSDPGSVQWVAELVELLAFCLAVAAPILALSHDVRPIEGLDKTALHVTGIVLFAAGLAGVIASQAVMGASWRIGVDPDERTELVTSGPYALVRHPIMSSFVLVFVGQALLVPSPVALAATALILIYAEVQARLVEEPYLRRTHDEAYDAYMRRTGRFVPRVGRGG